MRAMLLLIMEIASAGVVGFISCSVFMMTRMFFFKKKIDYPRACVIKDEGADFVT